MGLKRTHVVNRRGRRKTKVWGVWWLYTGLRNPADQSFPITSVWSTHGRLFHLLRLRPPVQLYLLLLPLSMRRHRLLLFRHRISQSFGRTPATSSYRHPPPTISVCPNTCGSSPAAASTCTLRGRFCDFLPTHYRLFPVPPPLRSPRRLLQANVQLLHPHALLHFRSDEHGASFRAANRSLT